MAFKFTLAFVLSLKISSLYSQSSSSTFADSAIAFKNFFRGGTTASLHYNSNRIDTMSGITRITIPQFDLDTLNLLISISKLQKHFQQKVGPSFYSYTYKDGKTHKIAVVPNFGFIDLTTGRQYNLKLTKYSSAFARFIDRNYR